MRGSSRGSRVFCNRTPILAMPGLARRQFTRRMPVASILTTCVFASVFPEVSIVAVIAAQLRPAGPTPGVEIVNVAVVAFAGTTNDEGTDAREGLLLVRATVCWTFCGVANVIVTVADCDDVAGMSSRNAVLPGTLTYNSA